MHYLVIWPSFILLLYLYTVVLYTIQLIYQFIGTDGGSLNYVTSLL